MMNNQKEIHCKIFLITVYCGTRNQLLNVGTKIIRTKELKYTSVYSTQGSSKHKAESRKFSPHFFTTIIQNKFKQNKIYRDFD